MEKYYIKEGYSEKGPLSIDDLKKLRVGKKTFVRSENSIDWVEADNLPELKSIFKKKFHIQKITLGALLTFIVVTFIIAGISNYYSSSNSTNNSFVEFEESIPPPPSIDFTVSHHRKKFLKELFKDCNLSGEKRQLVDACDYKNSIVRNKAVSIAGQNAGTYNLGQICDIFDYCNNNWKYVNDPNSNEVIEYASNTLSNGLNGDCDDFAVLICSMILAIGGEARINYAYGPNGGHAFTEVNIGNTQVEEYISKRYRNVYDKSGIWSRKDEQENNWLNLDWFAKHPGGKYFEYTKGTTFYIFQEYCNDFTK